MYVCLCAVCVSVSGCAVCMCGMVCADVNAHNQDVKRPEEDTVILLYTLHLIPLRQSLTEPEICHFSARLTASRLQ